MGNAPLTPSEASDTLLGIDEVEPQSLVGQFKLTYRKYSYISVWWPRDKKAYPGEILDIEDKFTPDGEKIGTAVTILYGDGAVQQYPLDPPFCKRAAIGKVA